MFYVFASCVYVCWGGYLIIKIVKSVEVLAPVCFLFLIAHVNTDTVVVQ